jgi:hypothetical protein
MVLQAMPALRIIARMTGIRVYGQATFHEIFRPILHRLNGLVWVVSEAQWRFPYEWDDASDFDPETGRYTSGPLADFDRDFQRITEGNTYFGYISTVDIFPKYAPAIGDDGLNIFGLCLAPEEAIEWLKKGSWCTPGYAGAVAQAEVSFICHESYWEFYTKHAALQEELCGYLPRTKDWPDVVSPHIQAGYEECSTE